LNPRNGRKKCWFFTSFPSTLFLICRDMEAVVFPVQNAYKMAYGGEDTTF
jgi:hypothetical protein